MSTEYLDTIIKAINEFDSETVKEASIKALEANVSPIEIIQKGIAAGLLEIGKKFETGEIFVTHLVAAAETAKAAISEVLEPAIKKSGGEGVGGPKVVLATVKGDIHDIGKNIVGAMLFSAGFEVIDIGKDVDCDEVIAKVKEADTQLVGLSALLSTSMPEMRRVIEALEAAAIRDKVKVMIGGAPVTEQYAQEIGADAYAENAAEAVVVAKRLLGVD
ncbi:MAG: cobalamin B12-binding domain-containing protein [Candidatus Thorarchaeota archaeon]